MQSAEMPALKTLRSGFFYLIVVMVMLIVAQFMPVIFIHVSSLAGIISMAIFAIALLLTVVVVSLYAVFGKIRPGMRQLSEADSGFRICYTGTTLMLVGLAMLALGTGIGIMVGIAMAMTFAKIENVALMILALVWFYASYIITFAGYVLTFVVGAFKLHGKYRNPLYVAAGIFFVLSIFLTFTGPLGLDAVFTTPVGLGGTAVGYVLMHTALGGTIKKLNTQS